MSKAQPIINRAEAGAAIDRAMDALKAIKNQLKAKKLSGSALNSLMEVAQDELRAVADPIRNQHYADIDALVLRYGGREGEI